MLENILELLRQKQPVEIVCFGDSITFGYDYKTHGQSPYAYPGCLEKLLRQRYQNPAVQVYNQGHFGWQSDEGLSFIFDEVVHKKPHLCVLMFGINDCKGSLAGGIPLGLKKYKFYLTQIISTLQQYGIEVILLSPTPAFVLRLSRYKKMALQVGQAMAVPTVDMFAAIDEISKQNREYIRKLLPDLIHFREDAYQYIAEILMDRIFLP